MVILPRLTPDTLDFVLLSFEGPDQYAMAGGLGVRMKELALELARQGFRTHLVFIGDPSLPAEESPVDNLTLYRLSQRVSVDYPGGVYHGEEAKLIDWNEQLPGFVTSRLVGPAAAGGRLTAILAEEWHTAYSTCQISDRLWDAGLRDKAIILWNANNVMGFDRIDWRRLDFCSQITTVSRYMKHVMWDRSVNPLVIPNGIPSDRIRTADPALVTRLRAAFPGRELVFKIGRFSPDKRWNMAMDALAEEKRRGHNIATVIRGGIEPHGMEVLGNARSQGLKVADVHLPGDLEGAIAALAAAHAADIYNVTSFMADELISLLYSGADAVLANSGHEPFGLVGLEVMAAAGVAFVGSTGEDYAVPFLNSVVLDTDDPAEINIAFDYLRAHPEMIARLRADAQETARSYTWENVIAENLIGKLEYVSLRQLVTPPRQSVASPDVSEESGADGDSGHTPPGRPLTQPVEIPVISQDPAQSVAYCGEAVRARLSVKPHGPVEEGPPEATGDPTAKEQPTANKAAARNDPVPPLKRTSKTSK
jgi:glycosyltransferase involved in cell wall biosynthesis